MSAQRLFSNGTEYVAFLNENCIRCPHFVHFEDATEEKPVCHVEEAIALHGIDPDTPSPMEWLDENEYMHRYDCRKKAGKERTVQT